MRRSGGRQMLGIILIVLGVVWALKNLDVFTYEFEYYYLSWPFFMMIIGIIIIIKSKGKVGGFILLFVGSAFFLSRLYSYSVGEIFRDFWPLFLIAIGISIMLEYWRDKPKQSNKNLNNGEIISDDYIDISAVLGEQNVNVGSDNFMGAKVTTIMGATKLNLANAKPANRCIVDILTIMGGTEIYVPTGWKVRNNVSALFGGSDESRRKSAPTEEIEKPELIVKGFVMFGGLEIKS